MGQRLLIVDSDRRFIKEHQVALEASFDVDVLFGTDGVVQRLDSGNYAAVLICVEVSENKGYALCSAIKKNPSLQPVKVGLISAKATEEEYVRHKSLKGRADVYLHKPIVSSALISALGALAPARAVDPDNPLGDFTGVDLGDEWLESLKTEIDSDIFQENQGKAPPPVVSPPHAASPHSAPAPTAPAQDAGKLMLMDERVKDLENKLVQQDELLSTKDRELADRILKHDAAIQRLDDLERQRVTMESHTVDRDQQIVALVQEKRSLEAQVQELSSRAKQLDEALEATSRLEDRIRELETQRAETERNREEAERRCMEAERSREELRAQMESRLAAVTNQDKEFLALKEDYIGLEATLRGQRRELAEQVHRVDALVRESEDLRGQVDTKNKALVSKEDELTSKLAAMQNEHSSKLAAVENELTSKLAAKENEHSSKLAAVEKDLTSKLAAKEDELTSKLAAVEKDLTSKLAAKEDELTSKLAAVEKDLGSKLAAKENELASKLAAKENELTSKLAAKENELTSRHVAVENHLSSKLSAATLTVQELEPFRTRVAELEEEISRITQDHEQQHNELLSGLEEREAKIGRLNLSVDAQLSQIGALEKDKRELEGQLRERMARMDALTQALADLEMGLKRASDLTRPF